MKSNYKEEITKLQKKLKNKLSSSRYEHSLGVAYTAGCLAMKYNEDMDKAIVAGLLHDCAKYMSPDEMLKIAVEKGIEISDVEKLKPDLLHAKLGSYYAKNKYKITDDDINNAILCHTTGKPNMTVFEKILYIADYIEPGRYKMPRLNKIREMAFIDLDKCLSMILIDTMNYLEKSNMKIDEMTKKTCDFYNIQMD